MARKSYSYNVPNLLSHQIVMKAQKTEKDRHIASNLIRWQKTVRLHDLLQTVLVEATSIPEPSLASRPCLLCPYADCCARRIKDHSSENKLCEVVRNFLGDIPIAVVRNDVLPSFLPHLSPQFLVLQESINCIAKGRCIIINKNTAARF